MKQPWPQRPHWPHWEDPHVADLWSVSCQRWKRGNSQSYNTSLASTAHESKFQGSKISIVEVLQVSFVHVDLYFYAQLPMTATPPHLLMRSWTCLSLYGIPVFWREIGLWGNCGRAGGSTFHLAMKKPLSLGGTATSASQFQSEVPVNARENWPASTPLVGWQVGLSGWGILSDWS